MEQRGKNQERSINKESDKVIDKDIEEALLNALKPAPVAPDRKQAMFARIMDRVHASPVSSGGFVTLHHDDGEWLLRAPGVYEKRLLDHPGRSASLYRMLPGSSFPAHEHPTDEECVCLEGEVSLGGIVIKQGDFHLAPQGVPHGKVTTESGCLLYIRCGAITGAA